MLVLLLKSNLSVRGACPRSSSADSGVGHDPDAGHALEKVGHEGDVGRNGIWRIHATFAVLL